MAENETLGTIRALRSIHGDFSTRRIPDSEIETILDAATRAANASNQQGYAIIVIDDPKRMRELFGYEASHALVFCVDTFRLGETARHMGRSYAENGITTFVTGSVDAALVAQTAVIAAKSLGIDSLVTNGLHRKKIDVVCRLLNLPDTGCFPLIAVAFGYPENPVTVKKGRLGADFVAHRGRYTPLTAEQQERLIAECDNPEKHIFMIDDWKEKGYAHYLDWFFDAWISPIPDEKNREVEDQMRSGGFL
jgi:nitroreductase